MSLSPRPTAPADPIVGDHQRSLEAGLRGPTPLEDFILREAITHFNHDRLPERNVHARGSAAYGYFECTTSLERYTRASVFAKPGKQTPVFVSSRPCSVSADRPTPRVTSAAGSVHDSFWDFASLMPAIVHDSAGP